MTDDEFAAAMSRTGLPLNATTLAELRRASVMMERMIERSCRDKPAGAEPAVIFYPGQRA